MESWESESMIFLRVDSMSSRITFVCSLSWSQPPVPKISERESSLACRLNYLTMFYVSWGRSEEWLIESGSVYGQEEFVPSLVSSSEQCFCLGSGYIGGSGEFWEFLIFFLEG